jgi:BirA family biotin operon repressor/biotin-[acetyl-CoA-carboxylase] ligase
MNYALSPKEIATHLGDAAAAIAIECLARTGSTNADLLQRLPHLDSPLLLVAEEQTAGRGRAGRSWLAEPHASLTFSLAWPFFRRDISGLLGLPLAVGVAVADTLAGFGVAASLKWPNDVQLGQAKLGGILIETGSVQRAGYRQPWAVIGIGLNIALTPPMLAEIGHEAAQMPQLLGRRNAVLGALAARLAQVLPRFDADGFAPFADGWNRLHAHAGQQVCIVDQGAVLQQGLAAGVDVNGCLLLDTAAGRIVITAGDVSLRPGPAAVTATVGGS